MIKRIVLAIAITFVMVGSANAWYLDIGPAGDYYGLVTTDVVWQSDGGAEEFLAGDGIFLTLENSTGADFALIQNPVYKAGIPAIFTVWAATGVTPTQAGNAVYNVSAYNSNATLAFAPADGTVLCSLVWMTDPGIVTFGSTPAYDVLQVNGVMYEGAAALPFLGPQVPIPGAFYLLACGLIGLIGLRRKMR